MEKIKLMIAGEEYNISTDDDLDYVAQLGQELDKKISSLMRDNARISITQAAIVTALEYADAAKKSERSDTVTKTQTATATDVPADTATKAENTGKTKKRPPFSVFRRRFWQLRYWRRKYFSPICRNGRFF